MRTSNEDRRGWRIGLWLGVLALSLVGRSAFAQTPSPLAEWQYSAGIQLQRLFEPSIPTWQIELGVGGQFAPIADGLARYRVQPGPVIDVRYKDYAFISTGEGIGINLLTFSHFRLGAAITYDLGREVSQDRTHLHGLENIDPAPEAKVFADYALAKGFPVTLRWDVRRQIGATDGWVGDFGAYTPLPGSSKSFAWFAGPTVTAGSKRYMDSYFGVTEYQTTMTNYRQYNAEAGLKSTGFGVSAAWLITPHVIVNVSSAVNRLLGSAAESPITESKLQGVVSFSAMYKF